MLNRLPRPLAAPQAAGAARGAGVVGVVVTGGLLCSSSAGSDVGSGSPEAAMTSSLVAVAGSNSRRCRPLVITTIRWDTVSASPTSEVA